MTRKDYVALARAIHGAQPEPAASIELKQWERVWYRIADVLEADNPRFDRQRFIDAVENGKGI